ncbi:MAG: hypothetical protein WHS65_03775 [Melioribacteraceae bacterium]
MNILNLPYMISGAVASIVYGEPRLTNDIDIIITLPLNKISDFLKIFSQEEFYCPPEEILKIEILKENRGHCNIIHHETGFKADIYFAGNDELNQWALQNINVINFQGTRFPVAPVEYVIIKKLEYYREGKSQKHIIDIKGILENSKNEINIDLLKKFIDKYGLTEEWNICVNEIGS